MERRLGGRAGVGDGALKPSAEARGGSDRLAAFGREDQTIGLGREAPQMLGARIEDHVGKRHRANARRSLPKERIGGRGYRPSRRSRPLAGWLVDEHPVLPLRDWIRRDAPARLVRLRLRATSVVRPGGP